MRKTSKNMNTESSMGLCFGMAIGCALGVVFENIAVVAAIGLSVGLAIGAVVGSKKDELVNEQMKNQNNGCADWTLEYYLMPDEYMGFDEKKKQIRNIDLTGWKMIHLGPDNSDKCSRSQRLFVEDVVFMSQLLFDLKDNDEHLIVSVCESWRKNIFRERILNGIADLCEEIPECFGGKGAFLYQAGNEITKYVYINQGETLECYCREDHLKHIVDVISKVATVTEYRKYELGE